MSKQESKSEDFKPHEKDENVGELTVRNRGKVDMSKIYTDLHQLIVDLGYKCPSDGTPYIEENYFQEDAQDGKYIKYKWKGNKKHDDIYTSYIELSAEVQKLVDIEKVEDNKKIVSNQADIKIKIKAGIIEKLDKEEISGFWHNFFPSFKKNYTGDQYDLLEEEVFDALMKIHNLAKNLLNLSA